MAGHGVRARGRRVGALAPRRDCRSDAVRRVGAIAIYPALAIVGFAIFSRVVVGEWFVSSGFFVPENKALGHPMLAVGRDRLGRAHAERRGC